MTKIEEFCQESDQQCLNQLHEKAVNELLMIISTGFIMLMQVGFAMLENGTVRVKNSKSILIKNIIDVSLGAFIWYLFGFGIGFGLRCAENCEDTEN